MAAGYGLITIAGNQYIEKFYQYTSIVTLNAAGGAAGTGFLQPRVTMDGDGGFLLKYLEVVYSVTGGTPNYFRCRLGNSDGSQWYSSAGVVSGGSANDRVHSLLMFGNGQFPFPVIPYILYLPNGSINLDLQDISGNVNIVEFCFSGSKLFNVDSTS
jgi:hypothetical protein